MQNTTESNNTNNTVHVITKAWEPAGKPQLHREYVKNLQELIGFSYEKYHSGSISSATLNGHEISNSEAKRILNWLPTVWIDADGKVQVKEGYGQEPRKIDLEELTTRVQAAWDAEHATKAEDTTPSDSFENGEPDAGEDW